MDAEKFYDQCTALVPVRAGSKGLPGKNTRPFAGLPLYERAAQQGARFAKRCVISTDIDAVLHSEPVAGRTLLPRPAALAGDTVPMDAVIGHVLEALDLHEGAILLLQATSPLRQERDIAAACALFRQGGHDLVLSVTRTDPVPLKYGFLDSESQAFHPVSSPRHCFTNRQSLPPLYRPNGAVFVFDIAGFRRRRELATDRIGAVTMSEDDSLDIDTLADFEKAEARLNIRQDPLSDGLATGA